jgi:hypothetical protein
LSHHISSLADCVPRRSEGRRSLRLSNLDSRLSPSFERNLASKCPRYTVADICRAFEQDHRFHTPPVDSSTRNASDCEPTQGQELSATTPDVGFSTKSLTAPRKPDDTPDRGQCHDSVEIFRGSTREVPEHHQLDDGSQTASSGNSHLSISHRLSVITDGEHDRAQTPGAFTSTMEVEGCQRSSPQASPVSVQGEAEISVTSKLEE